MLSVGLFGWSALYVGKFLTLLLLSLVWLSPLLLVDVLRMEHVRRGVLAALAICAVAYVFSDLLPTALPQALRQVIFGGGFDYHADTRARGFTDESSSFATLVARLALIAYLIWEARRPYNGRRLLLVLAGLALALVALGSKGAVVGIALAMLAVSLGKKQWRHLVLLLPMAWWTATTQLEAISIDLAEFSSTSTRVGMLMTGLLALAANPLGYGYYGFYGAVNKFGNVGTVFLTLFVSICLRIGHASGSLLFQQLCFVGFMVSSATLPVPALGLFGVKPLASHAFYVEKYFFFARRDRSARSLC
jgi:hypothetical protein